jgi:hypothetical protein
MGASLAYAQPVPFEIGESANATPPAAFSGTMSYDSALSRLTVFLQNDSPLDNLGSLTGFVFNSDGDAVATYSDPDLGGGFQALTDGPGANAGAFGQYEYGAALGGDFMSGGDPDNGFFPLESGNFFFNVTINGSAAGDAVKVEDFLSQNGVNGTINAPLAVRFRAFADDGDNIVGVKAKEVPPPSAIPLPAAAWSALSGLALLPIFRKRMTRRRPA